MKLKIVISLIGLSFLFNGCLATKIKQRIYYLQNRDKVTYSHSTKKIGHLYKKSSKKVSSHHIKRKKTFTSHVDSKQDYKLPPQKELYVPSKVALVKSTPEVEVVTTIENPKIETYETKHFATKSNSHKKKIQSQKKKKHVAKKHVTHKIHKRKEKIVDKTEPYSIESDKGDPELLGPQTTLDSNPLKKEGK